MRKQVEQNKIPAPSPADENPFPTTELSPGTALHSDTTSTELIRPAPKTVPKELYRQRITV